MSRSLALAAALAFFAGSVRAEPVPLGVVVRGGASLGSFEAGALFELTELTHSRPELLTPRVYTGTSAGSINGLIAALTEFGAGAHESEPERSLFYRSWIPVGTKGMFDADAVSATGAFTRSQAMAGVTATILAHARAGLRAGTELVFAVPVTRLLPRSIDLDPDGALQTQQAGESFVLRLTGHGYGQLPTIDNVQDPRGPKVQPALVTEADGHVGWRSMVDVVIASAAVPPAFAPVQIAHCLVARGQEATCPRGRARTDGFVDGGFVDNLPLGLAVDAMTHVEHAGDDALYLLVDPQEVTFAKRPKPKPSTSSFRAVGQRLAGGLLDAVQGAELRAILAREHDLGKRLSVLQSELPLASSPLQTFMGFFETDFRTFDFAVGMHEARRLAREGFRSAAFGSGPIPLPPLSGHSGMQRRAACLEAFLDGVGDVAVCGGEDLANFRALLQTSVERLYVQCTHLPRATLATLHPDRRREAWCLEAARGHDPPHVPGNDDGDWHLRAGESGDPLPYVTRRLAAHGFVWKDLGIGHASAHRARVELSLRVGEILRALAAAQPDNSLLYRSGARALAQQLEYVPPAHAFHFLSGLGFELGYSVTRRAAPYRPFRLATAVVLDGVPSLVDGGARSYFATSPELGLEVEPPPLTNANVQTRLLVRGGFQLSTGDGFGSRRDHPTAGTPSSRPVVDVAAAVCLLQWIRVQVGLGIFPPFHGEGTHFTLRSGLGVQLDLPL